MELSESRQVKAALAAADSAVLLQSPAQTTRAAKAWRRCLRLGLDTEFVRERTYHANIGLVQVSDGQTVWLLDPLVRGNLDPLADMLANPDIVKIMHSPSEDFEILGHVTDALPEPAFDTQIACAMLGQPLQMGYHMAVEWLFGIGIDKDQTRSNWRARPLKPAQLRYAALDVCLLPLMWRMLESRLLEAGRLDWCLEDCQRQVERARSPVDAAESWQRIRGNGRLDGVSLAVLRDLARWRENEARKRNQPRGFILPDNLLLTIARSRITKPEDLESLDGLHPAARQRYGHVIARLVQDTLDSGRWIEPARQMSARQRKMLKLLRDRVTEKARELNVEPALLASKKELEGLVQEAGRKDIPERLQGWRNPVVTTELLQVLGDRQ